MNKIEWIFFDVGGVLTDESRFTNWIQTQVVEVVKKYQPAITLEKVRSVRPIASGMKGNLNQNMLRVLLTGPSLETALTEMKHIRDHGPTHWDLQEIRPDALEVVKHLAKKYSLGIVANQHREMKDKLDKAGILEFFKQKDVSEDYKMLKPDPGFFKLVMERAGASPESSALVDDNLERAILPAEKLGMITVWYKSENREAPPGVVDFTITSLKELLRIF